MADITQARAALIARILEGDGMASKPERRAAFDNVMPAGPLNVLVEKVVRYAYKVTDEDVVAARSTGLSEDQVFEVVVCAAVGEANREYEAALAALHAASGEV